MTGSGPLAGKRGLVIPGDGVVARWPDGVLVAVGPRALLDRLLTAVDEVTLPALVAQAIIFDWDAEGGGFMAMTVAGDRLTVEGAGACDVVVNGRRTPAADAPAAVADPAHVVGAIDRRAEVPSWVGVGQATPGIDRALSLDGGVVVGAGLLLVTDEPTARIEIADRAGRSPAADAGAPPVSQGAGVVATDAVSASGPGSVAASGPAVVDAMVEAAETAERQAVSAASAASFELFDLDGPVDGPRNPLPITTSHPPMPPGRPPAPAATGPEGPGERTVPPRPPVAMSTVNGVLCPDGHFNHPETTACIVCGVAIDHASGADVEGERPALGYLVMDDGTSYQLTRNYVIGRSPADEPGYEPIILDDDGISRTHARIVLDGWDVVLTDAGSKNGTGYRRTPEQRWDRLGVDRSVTLEPGSSIDIGGRRTLTFEAVPGQGR